MSEEVRGVSEKLRDPVVLPYYLPENWGNFWEGGMDHVCQKVNVDKMPFIIITAYKTRWNPETSTIEYRSYDENQRDNSRLVSEFKKYYLGSTMLVSGWKDKIAPREQREISFFVTLEESILTAAYELRALAIKWAIRFQQKGVIFGDGENIYYLEFKVELNKPKATVTYLWQKKIGSQDTITLKDVEVFSRNKGKAFVFEGCLLPDCWAVAVMLGKIQNGHERMPESEEIEE